LFFWILGFTIRGVTVEKSFKKNAGNGKRDSGHFPINRKNAHTQVMNTLSYRTESISADMVERKWYVVDATDLATGRLSAEIATILRGKNKPSYTPHADTGDYVIVVNADKVRFTGHKWDQKVYKDYSLHPGGLKVVVAADMLVKFPERIIQRAVKGMLPKTKLGKAMIKKLFIYTGAEHPHAAQKPQALKIAVKGTNG
jgi:large subunit ribosomal protein L13